MERVINFLKRGKKYLIPLLIFINSTELVLGIFLISRFQPVIVPRSGESQKREEIISSYTKQLETANSNYKNNPKKENIENVKKLAILRKDELLKEMEISPADFLKDSSLTKKRGQYPTEVQQYIEEDKKIEGKFSHVVGDNEKDGKPLNNYYIISNKTAPQLFFVNAIPHVNTGTNLNISGVGLENKVAVSYANFGSSQSPRSLGAQSTIVMLVNFQGYEETPYLARNISWLMFGDGPTTVTNYYRENSFDKTWFEGDVVGWYTLPLPTYCDRYGIADKADAIATANGVDLSKYQHIAYLFPKDIPNMTVQDCGSSGWATIGGDPGRTWWLEASPALFEHELGHTLGLGHSNSLFCNSNFWPIDDYSNCVDTEYGGIGLMANHTLSPHIDGPQKTMMGWFKDQNVKLVDTSGTYTLAPLEKESNSVQIIKIPKNDTNEFYYLSYRQPLGTDVALNANPKLFGGIYLQIATENPGVSTKLLDATPDTLDIFDDAPLMNGRSFYSKLNNFTITQLKHDINSVTFKITLGYIPEKPPEKVKPPFVCDACSADFNNDGVADYHEEILITNCQGLKSTDKYYQWWWRFGGFSCAPADLNGDGIVNEADLGCIKSSAVYYKTCDRKNICTTCSANVDKDPNGYVTLTDFSLVSSCLGKVVTENNDKGISCKDADTNGDGYVDTADLNCVQQQFGKQCELSSSLKSNYFHNDPTANAIIAGTNYKFRDYGGSLPVTSFEYKVLNAVKQLGFVKLGFTVDQYEPKYVATLHKFQRKYQMALSDTVDKNIMVLLDQELSLREKTDESLAKNFEPLLTFILPPINEPPNNHLAALYKNFFDVMPKNQGEPINNLNDFRKSLVVGLGGNLGKMMSADGKMVLPLSDAVNIMNTNGDFKFCADYYYASFKSGNCTTPTELIKDLPVDDFNYMYLITHEYGHIVGRQNNGKLNSDFGKISNGFFSNYAKANSAEDFAESFAAYVQEGKIFKERIKNEPDLKQKYDFLKQNVFDNVEFDTGGLDVFNNWKKANGNTLPSNTIGYYDNSPDWVWDYKYLNQKNLAGPTIDSIDPSATTSSQTVTIRGNNFGSQTGVVYFYKDNGSTSNLSIDTWSENEIRGKTSGFSDGNYQVAVKSSAGKESNKIDFKIILPTFSFVCTPCSANIDNDPGGYVTLTDFSRASACNGKLSTESDINGHSCADSDINKDGKVDSIDASCVQSMFGKQCIK